MTSQTSSSVWLVGLALLCGYWLGWQQMYNTFSAWLVYLYCAACWPPLLCCYMWLSNCAVCLTWLSLLWRLGLLNLCGQIYCFIGVASWSICGCLTPESACPWHKPHEAACPLIQLLIRLTILFTDTSCCVLPPQYSCTVQNVPRNTPIHLCEFLLVNQLLHSSRYQAYFMPGYLCLYLLSLVGGVTGVWWGVG